MGDTPLVADALARIKGMVAEMPGTEWTVTDAARLSGLETSVCRAILDALRHAGFLTQRADGSYVRSTAPGVSSASGRDPSLSRGLSRAARCASLLSSSVS